LIKVAQFAEEWLDIFQGELHIEVGLLKLLGLALKVLFQLLQKLLFLVFDLIPLKIVLDASKDSYSFLALRLRSSCPLKGLGFSVYAYKSIFEPNLARDLTSILDINIVYVRLIEGARVIDRLPLLEEVSYHQNEVGLQENFEVGNTDINLFPACLRVHVDADVNLLPFIINVVNCRLFTALYIIPSVTQKQLLLSLESEVARHLSNPNPHHFLMIQEHLNVNLWSNEHQLGQYLTFQGFKSCPLFLLA
jgi:hypothetical protein